MKFTALKDLIYLLTLFAELQILKEKENLFFNTDH